MNYIYIKIGDGECVSPEFSISTTVRKGTGSKVAQSDRNTPSEDPRISKGLVVRRDEHNAFTGHNKRRKLEAARADDAA